MLDKPILLLGRESECDIQFDSRKVSRRHCCIAQVGDRLIVRDLGSTNGIRINGVRVVEGNLKAGDELTIGNQRYRVSWGEIAPGPRKSVPVKQPAKEASRRVTVQDVDDDVLEAADEPIPIFDEAGRGPGAAPGKSPYPAIIPEHLELASSGDSFSSNPPPIPPAS